MTSRSARAPPSARRSPPLHALPGLEAAFAAKGAKALLGPPDPHAGKAAGGMGIVAEQAQAVRRLCPIEKKGDLADAIAAGRVDLFAVDLPGGPPLVAYNIYLWAGSSKDPERRRKGDRVLEAVFEDQGLRRCARAAIAGDFNARPEEYPGVAGRLATGAWVDPGRHDWPEAAADQATCYAPNAKEGTRRDAIIFTAEAAALVVDYAIEPAGDFHVHQAVTAKLSVLAGVSRRSGFPASQGGWLKRDRRTLGPGYGGSGLSSSRMPCWPGLRRHWLRWRAEETRRACGMS